MKKKTIKSPNTGKRLSHNRVKVILETMRTSATNSCPDQLLARHAEMDFHVISTYPDCVRMKLVATGQVIVNENGVIHVHTGLPLNALDLFDAVSKEATKRARLYRTLYVWMRNPRNKKLHTDSVSRVRQCMCKWAHVTKEEGISIKIANENASHERLRRGMRAWTNMAQEWIVVA